MRLIVRGRYSNLTRIKRVGNRSEPFLVFSYVYSKQPIFGLTQEWLKGHCIEFGVV